ncbi:cytochrome P450 [Streptacidiphilus sp. P02-A3a]|uniref:cytochrome P450 n=1 Tax=Streptacidiphilus sp. P02-A3a TaxID=2704468 RepID=UPI0015FDBD63|nr:cytochrome P450 [Streptacidiphilus sp. P02-A3a]QMU69766.1 cytochrome P450 [Streptacidiphilus sp. P02-A3a]
MPDGSATGDSYRGFEVDDGYRRVHGRDERVCRFAYHGERWLVAGYQEVLDALKDDTTFSSAHDLPNTDGGRLGVMTPPTSIRALPIEVDPPEYQRYRRMLTPRFSPAAVRAMTPSIREFTTWCIDQSIDTGEMNVYDDLIKMVPALTTMKLLGLPLEDSLVVAKAVHARGADRFDLNPAWRHLLHRVDAAVQARRDQPGDDLISDLLAQEPRVSGEEIAQACFAVVVGGMSTTAKLTLGALSYFGVHPDRRAPVRDDPERLRSAMEEFLRYYSPVPFLCRTATRDLDIGGLSIERGERIALGFAAANRDPAVFQDPDTIDIDRSPNRHLAMGHGIHYCIGAALGRAEATVMVEEVLHRMPDYRLTTAYAPGHRTRRVNWNDRMERGMTIAFTPGPRTGRARDLVFVELPG